MTYWSAGTISIDGVATTDNRWIAQSNYDSNSDTKVTQTNSSTNNFRPIIVGYDSYSKPSSYTETEVTNIVYKSGKAFLQTSSGNFYGNSFSACNPISGGDSNTTSKRCYITPNGITANNYKANY